MLLSEAVLAKRVLQWLRELVIEVRCYLLLFEGKNKLGMYSDSTQYI